MYSYFLLPTYQQTYRSEMKWILLWEIQNQFNHRSMSWFIRKQKSQKNYEELLFFYYALTWIKSSSDTLAIYRWFTRAPFWISCKSKCFDYFISCPIYTFLLASKTKTTYSSDNDSVEVSEIFSIDVAEKNIRNSDEILIARNSFRRIDFRDFTRIVQIEKIDQSMWISLSQSTISQSVICKQLVCYYVIEEELNV